MALGGGGASTAVVVQHAEDGVEDGHEAVFQREEPKHQYRCFLAGLAKGDEVVAGGGMLGKVTKVTENYVTIEIAQNVEVQVQKPSIQLVLPKGTLRNAT